MKNAKWIVAVLVTLIAFSVFGEEAAQSAPEKGSVFWSILHVFFVALSGVLVTAATLGINKLFRLISKKWDLEGIQAFEGMAANAVVNAIHYAEAMAAKKALDSKGVLKSTGSDKFDTAMRHIKETLGLPFVQEYGEEKLKKLVESMLAQNDLGPIGSSGK